VANIAAFALAYFLWDPAAFFGDGLRRLVTNSTGVSAAAPVAVVALLGLLPTSWKEVLVFFRITNRLPSSCAFTYHAQRDPRIDLRRLRASVGELPEAPGAQTAAWYRLYKINELRPSVEGTLRHYLLMRDAAALAALSVALLGPAAVVLARPLVSAAAVYALLLLLQLALSVVAARNYGTRLVTNVLAEASASSQ
jgi:hypothetical protein